ncbi:hypothetical protein B0H10DRAFT_693376 [Mycena sp. CBHHK59/15]|nr:hypothetical protein B0H10DRAFT_693376 [Mycena sp. CBHHK59/15]
MLPVHTGDPMPPRPLHGSRAHANRLPASRPESPELFYLRQRAAHTQDPPGMARARPTCKSMPPCIAQARRCTARVRFAPHGPASLLPRAMRAASEPTRTAVCARIAAAANRYDSVDTWSQLSRFALVACPLLHMPTSVVYLRTQKYATRLYGTL